MRESFYKKAVSRMIAAVLITVLLAPSTTFAAYKKLEKGSTGKDVYTLEEALVMQGYLDEWPDEKYDSATVAAVKAFQKAQGITADGIAGNETQSKILAYYLDEETGSSVGDLVVTIPSNLRILSSKSSGADVESLQTRLTQLGYYSGRISGSYGSLTETAVKNFQAANGLSADGKAGIKTQTKMYEDTAVLASAAGGVSTVVSTTSTTLKSGMSGAAVSTMQQKLKDLGYYDGPVSGNFGNVTWEAVRKFQRKSGLSADGVAGTKTLEKLYGTESTTGGEVINTDPSSEEDGSSSSSTAIKLGSRGDEVKAIQAKLKTLGYLAGTADGIFGLATQTALSSFQLTNGLTVDGIAGSKTVAKLNSSSAISAGGSSTGSTNVVLKNGVKNSTEVKTMQQQLTKLGYYTGKITGNFGDLTETAVKYFQKKNGLSSDGIAGANTLKKLYSGSAIDLSSSGSSGSSGNSSGSSSKNPKAASVQNVNWYDGIRKKYKAGTVMDIYDFSTGYSWQCVMMSNGKHSDSQPRTADDTSTMYKAFGNKNTWTAKAVWVTMPDGQTYIASMHNMPHLSGSIKDNNFNGHLCIHFPREMSEAEDTGPYAVSHQKAIIAGWAKTQAMK